MHLPRFSLCFIFFLLTGPISAKPVSLKDNILFAFEKCKSLSVDLEKGQLKESIASSFDLHCRKSDLGTLEFRCTFFDTGSDKKTNEIAFTGGSELGIAELQDGSGRIIKFLIGKKFASYESASEQKVCAGIFIFEQDALKQQASSPKSGL